MKRWLSAHMDLVSSMLEFLDTPVSLGVYLRLKHGCFDSLALSWVDPLHYPEGIFNAIRYRKDVQAVDLLRKSPLPTTFNRRDVALETWEKAETQCFLANEYIDSLLFKCPASLLAFDSGVKEFLDTCKKVMSRVLGPIPSGDLEWGFGPGTCVEYKEELPPTVVDKVYLTPTTTPQASDIFLWAFNRTLWSEQRAACQLPQPGLSVGNRFTTVPKDGKTDRPISIEPLGNLWLQKGIGAYLKRRLKLMGLPAFKPAVQVILPGLERVELDAQSVHREMLYRCRTEGYSTIDLSSASDTLCSSLVRAILPHDWFELLDCCRSRKTLLPVGKAEQKGSYLVRHLEKFSSMGNGFTFELESLIFVVLLKVAFRLTPGVDLYVFGDDIILPSRHFDAACNLLSTVGFSINRRKSYKEGPFFESCGGNVHSGIDVTPVRIKDEVDEPPEIFALHNALKKWGFPPHILRRVKKMLPIKLRLTGPERLGDIVLHTPTYKTFFRSSDRNIAYVRSLKVVPEAKLTIERWSPELHMTALFVNNLKTVVGRRGQAVKYMTAWASVS